MFLSFGSSVLNPSRVHNTGWAILILNILQQSTEQWRGHHQHPIPWLSLWCWVLTQCAVVQVVKSKMLIVSLKMSFRPPEDDVSLEPGGVARLTAEDLGTFWSRRKKSRASQAHLPFSSFWSRRKKSRPKLPSLPFSTIIRYEVTMLSWLSRYLTQTSSGQEKPGDLSSNNSTIWQRYRNIRHHNNSPTWETMSRGDRRKSCQHSTIKKHFNKNGWEIDVVEIV